MAAVRTVGWGPLLLVLGALVSCGEDFGAPAEFDPQEIALVRVEPADGASDVPRNRSVRMYFNTSVLPESVHDQSIRVRTGGTFQTRPEGSFVISGNVVEFDPTVSTSGGRNSIGFPAGQQILVEIPLKTTGDRQPAQNFVQNIEGNPITVASGDNIIVFTTGCGWDDKVPGPPGVLALEFTPSANAVGQVPSDAAVTVVFSEPVDPESVILGINMFLTNNTVSAGPGVYQQDIPSNVFYDGSLTRYTLKPVFGFGTGPFNVALNFIDPDAPDTFDPDELPRDLGGNQVQNFTFLRTFDTQFDPVFRDVGTIVENFTTQAQRDAGKTDALWGTDSQLPFALVGALISTRIQTIDVNAILNNGGTTSLPDINTHPSLPAGPLNEGRYCSPNNPLVGPDLIVAAPYPPTSSGARTMNVYRSAEMGPAGTILRASWAPLNDTTTASSYNRVIIRIGHKKPNLNLTVQAFSTEFDVDTPVQVADGRYSVTQSIDVNGDGFSDTGFVDWLAFDNLFAYDGTNDLLLDVQAQEGTASQYFRAFYAVTQVPSAFACTCQAMWNNTGDCSWNNSIGMRGKEGIFGSDFINPVNGPTVVPTNPGPYVYLARFELAKLTSKGTSLYYDTGSDEPDYLAPIVGPLVQPCGASLGLRWSGSRDGVLEDVPFTTNIDSLDGVRYIRFEATLNSNLFTGSRAVIRILTVPFVRE